MNVLARCFERSKKYNLNLEVILWRRCFQIFVSRNHTWSSGGPTPSTTNSRCRKQWFGHSMWSSGRVLTPCRLSTSSNWRCCQWGCALGQNWFEITVRYPCRPFFLGQTLTNLLKRKMQLSKATQASQLLSCTFLGGQVGGRERRSSAWRECGQYQPSW